MISTHTQLFKFCFGFSGSGSEHRKEKFIVEGKVEKYCEDQGSVAAAATPSEVKLR